MKFDIYGPYELNRDKSYNLIITKDWLADFWGEIEKIEPGLKSACGCYVFSINKVPYYVGMTQKSFYHETFNASNITSYRHACYDQKKCKPKKGIPYMYFVAQKTKTGRFANITQKSKTKISELESFFIGKALEKNPDLINQKKTSFFKSLEVPGFFNVIGKPPKSAIMLKDVLSKENLQKK